MAKTPIKTALAVPSYIVLAFTACLILVTSSEVVGHGELQIRIAGLTRQIEASPQNAQLYLERGELHREHLDWAAAEADFAKAEQLDPTLSAIHVGRARLLVDRGEFERALAMFNKALDQSPNDADALIGRARLLLRLGRRTEAIADFERGVTNLKEPDPTCFHDLATALVAEGRTNDALAALDLGIRKMPVLSLQQYGFELELDRKNYEAALTRLDRIIQAANRKETWLTRRAEVLLLAGRNTEARASLQAAQEAIKTLPMRIQQAPPIQQLNARIEAAYAKANADSIKSDK